MHINDFPRPNSTVIRLILTFYDYWLQTADHRLQTAYSGPQTVDYTEETVDSLTEDHWPQILKTAELNPTQILVVFSVFTSHVIKTENRNHSMKIVKSLRYDKWLIYKEARQETGLCCFSFARYLQKCVTKIYRALNGDAMFVPLWVTQTWQP